MLEAESTKPRTLHRSQISEWRRDNRHISTGYRPEKANYYEVFASLTFLHNESCNVYTHLTGALILPFAATLFMRLLSRTQTLDVSGTDYFMCGIFFWCAECCLIFSTTYHLVGFHSHEVEQFWHRMDLLGIVIVTVGTFVSGIYYIFPCEPILRNLHWAIVRPFWAVFASPRSPSLPAAYSIKIESS